MFGGFKKTVGKAKKPDNAAAVTVPVRADAPTAQDYLRQGNQFLGQGQLDNARQCYLQAQALNPHQAEIYINLGYVLKEQQQYAQARACLLQAISLNPQLADVFYLLGEIAIELGDKDDALLQFKSAVDINPDFSEALGNIATLVRDQGRPEQALDYYSRALAANPDNNQRYSSLLWCLQYGGVSREELAIEHLGFGRRFEPALAPFRLPHGNNRDTDRPLKVGYVSADFKRHPVALFMLPLLEHHDREQIQVYCYYNNTTSDELTLQIRDLADEFVPCAALSDEQLAARIRADGIDILVDLSGHTANNRLLMFARKPAPVQVTYLGYVDTTGLAAMDYRLSNHDADPPGNEAFCSEKLYRFDESMWWAYRPADGLPALTPLPALGNGYVTFVSVNDFLKVSALNVQMWSAILQALPSARLMVMGVPAGAAQHSLRARFAAAGLDPARLELYARLPLQDYRNLLLQADIALDTSPFNGGTTTCETLYLGLPVVTLKGQAFAGRMGYAILNDLGLSELVAENLDDYVRIAVALAQDINWLAALRQGLRTRIRHSSMSDEHGFTRKLEAAYRQMWRSYLADTVNRP